MQKNKGKISVRQLMLLFIITVYAPSVRFLSGYTAQKATHSGWLSPTVSFLILLLLLYVFKIIYGKYKDSSFMDIIYDITSNFFGKIIISIYFIWLALIISLYIRYYAERLVTSIYPNVNINIFIITMLLLVSLVIRSGLVVITRMNEIIVVIISSIFFILIFLLIPNVKISNLTPLSYIEIVPIMKGSIGMTGLLYLPFLLFFSHKISNIENIFKEGLKAGLFIWLFATLLLISSIGTMGHSLIGRSPLSFLIVVKNIKVLGVISGLESILIATWIMTDFIIIIIFTYSAMQMIKSLFNLSDYKPYINIYLIIQYFLTMSLAFNVFELHALSSDVTVLGNVIFLIIFPLVLFLIGRIRKKI